jgi:choloylglycine hydrolase
LRASRPDGSAGWQRRDPLLTVLSRGLPHDGGRIAGADIVREHPLRWTSRYGSLVTTVYGVGTADGLNERGFSAHMLYLTAADDGRRDGARPGLHAGLWAQYLLDNAADVGEALTLLDRVQIVMAEARGTKATVHLAIEDASGDSAVIEFVGGQQVLHHGRDVRIMTNDPPYDEQLGLRKAPISRIRRGLARAEPLAVLATDRGHVRLPPRITPGGTPRT